MSVSSDGYKEEHFHETIVKDLIYYEHTGDLTLAKCNALHKLFRFKNGEVV